MKKKKRDVIKVITKRMIASRRRKALESLEKARQALCAVAGDSFVLGTSHEVSDDAYWISSQIGNLRSTIEREFSESHP